MSISQNKYAQMRCRLSFLSPSLYPPLIALHIKASDLLRRPQKGIVISYLVFRDRRHCKSLWFIPPNTESARSWLSAPEAAGCAMEGFQGPGCLLVSARGSGTESSPWLPAGRSRFQGRVLLCPREMFRFRSPSELISLLSPGWERSRLPVRSAWFHRGFAYC